MTTRRAAVRIRKRLNKVRRIIKHRGPDSVLKTIRDSLPSRPSFCCVIVTVRGGKLKADYGPWGVFYASEDE